MACPESPSLEDGHGTVKSTLSALEAHMAGSSGGVVWRASAIAACAEADLCASLKDGKMIWTELF